ncbi:hypothetical protein NQ315_006756 [Exocentrus adspersus]|uniref:Uncharacterized protein n=1 Tax=Exocentrus adspersus TaxID=1586481 RepID=A0AAV8WBF2_9CUCU|nr:hypothetical protein NQ315_006756 [Exocentrus adspersus]
MHISEHLLSPNILTKCSKMTEEGQRLYGMNGNGDRNIKEECQKANYGQGGRLKFFKDGKFILELERAREGERVSWVSVPRKIFWPPQGTASSAPSYRQESNTSLSVSDDNSSIQSSPWQRDHSWKQTNPCRNISKEMMLYFWRPKNKRLTKRSRKRRAPYSLALESDTNSVTCSERTSVKSKKKSPKHCLLMIVQNLIDKNFRTSTPPRAESVVSPRKRFLREMEKDKLQTEDSNCQKRSRSKPIQTVPLSPSQSVKAGSPVLANGTEDIKPARNCSYSITSLLAEDRNIKRSPSNSPSHFSPVAQAQYCSPSPEDRWYTESVDRLRSIELSQVEKCGSYTPYPPQSYLGPYMYPFPPMPPYYGSGIYSRGYAVPAVYHTSPPHVPIRHETPSCSWSLEPKDVDHREETITDMPLNLSKHSG